MRIVILTGAGISAESGIATFRDKGGLWESHRWQDLATPQAFARDPQTVQRFYDMRRAKVAQAQPNAAHLALARLQAARRHDVTLITQNVDDLHEKAGSDPVVHMHGSHQIARCAACGHRWPAPQVMAPATACPRCGEMAARPDVVWFGEMPHHLDLIQTAVTQADLFAAIGTSGNVYPAAGFVRLARQSGATCTELNLVPSDVAEAFHHHHLGPASQTVPAWVDSLLGDRAP